MSNKNFGEPWEGKIERIRENLVGGKYAPADGIFPIVKELVQNAEDANARQLVFALIPGLPNAIHPLLRAPALLAINDGVFDKENARAIREMGLSSKAADSSSIGKFGLGMKSVFYLSEAFFFVAFDENGQQVDADLRSPWSAHDGLHQDGLHQDGLHQDWDKFDRADIDRIADHVKSLAWNSRWFCLWLPLRRKCDLNDIDPIESYYPGDMAQDELLGQRQAEQLSVLIPMLSHLSRIEFRVGDATHNVHTEIRIGETSTRRTSLSKLKELPSGKPHLFNGEVNSRVDSKAYHSIYAGIELRPFELRLCALEHNDKWPKRFATDKATGKSKQVPEKAYSHSAICFTASQCSAKKARLKLHWSVFLPLGTSEELLLPGCEWSIDLFLHGWFFPNSGRTEVEGLTDDRPPLDRLPDSSSVRRAWNHCLARCGTLPLIPAALAQFVEHSKWDSTVTVAVTRTLQHSPLFGRFIREICRDRSWLLRLTSDSRLLWQTVPSTSDYFEFPELGDAINLNLLFKALPSLREQLESRVVVIRGDPLLTAAKPSRWTTESISELLLTAVPEAIFASEALLSWLTTLLDDCAQQDAWKQLGFELAGVARGGLPVVVADHSVRLITAAKKFLARIPPTLRVNLARTIGDDATSRELFDLVCQQPAEVVWIPEDCAPENSKSSGTVSAKQAEVVLKALAAWSQRQLSNPAREKVGEFAAHVIRATPELQVQELLRLAGALELFVGTNCREQKEQRLSWNDIVKHQGLHALFARPSPMAKQLQDALAEESIVLISPNISRLLFGEDHEATKQCREGQLLAALSAIPKPRLTGPTQRRKLLETLLGYSGGRGVAQFKDCVRFVLHGSPDRYGVAEPLLVRSSGSSDIWRRMTSIALKALGQEWRLLDSAFASVLSEDDHREFEIDVIGSPTAITLARKLISNNGSSAEFFSLRPTGDEYRELLHQIEDVDLCRRLPIHEDLTGEFVSINDHSFWQNDDWEVPEDLAPTIRLLKLNEDDATRKRQLQLAHPLDAIRLVGIVLDHQTPSTFLQILLDALGALDPIPADLLTKLSSAIWMPTTSAGFIKPEDVIHLPELRDGVSRLTAAHPGVYFDPESLAKDLRQHPAFDRIMLHVVPRPARALEMLGTLLQENNRNLVGRIDVSFEAWLESFRAADADLIPQRSLLQTLYELFPETACRTFDELRQPISEQRVHELLDFLRVEHERDRSKLRQERLLCTYGKYLSTLLTPETFEERVRKMQLPTRDGTWRVAEELCCQNDGVSLQAILALTIEEAIAPFIPQSLNQDTETVPRGSGKAGLVIREPDWNVAAATQRLQDYFDSWRDMIPNEQIGGFLALLGDEPTLRDLAQQFLGHNRTVETTREKFGLPEMPTGDHTEDGPTMISKQRVVVEVVEEPIVQVPNLFGRPIEVHRNERPATLFVGYGNRANPFPHKVVDGLRVRCFRLNAINPREFTEVELSHLLRDSAVEFIGKAYNSYKHQTCFAATWNELTESDQLDIRITQSRIIKHGFLILDQYRLRSDPHLLRVLDQWDTADRLEADRETQGVASGRHSQRNPDRELQMARVELRKLLESAEHHETQQRILEAVRHLIADSYQYKPDSVPFELFQNADDAYAELSQYFPPPHTHDLPTVILRRDGNRLVFAHFGRRINQYPVGGEQSSRGFDNDLWKMSVLSLSNKGYAVDGPKTAVTGKFGLGFKSVFLACDRPRLLSGRLAFEFVGGVYPRRLIGEERHSLDKFRSSNTAEDAMATIIEMEMREGVEPLEVINRFARLAHLLVVFGRSVRCCRLSEEGKDDEEVRWEQPDDVPHNPGVQAGTVRPLRSFVPNATTSNVLLFKSEAGSLLFRLGARKFERFADQAPTVWVFAPTAEQLDLGFLVNGPFSLDVGRAQLARDTQHNEEAARRLGKQFGEQLEQLFESSQSPGSWIEVRKSLQLAADAASFEFWDSLWDLVVIAVDKGTTLDKPADQLVRDILWNTPDQGAAGFYAKKKAVPTRLPGVQFEREMVSLNKVHYSLRGVLSQDDGYALACVQTWPKFRDWIGDSPLVSDEKIVEPLRDRELCATLVKHITPIDLPDVLGWELAYRMVGVDDANRFGKLINKEFLASLRDNSERTRLKDSLKTTEFLAGDGRYHPASRLLIGHVAPGIAESEFHDERRRAAFAPKERVINAQYDSKGVEFFVPCRDELNATATDMAGWVLVATDIATQRAALEYLTTGKMGRAIQQELKQRGMEGTWLKDLSEHPAFQDMAAAEKGGLLGLLPEGVAAEIVEEAIQKSPEVQRQLIGRSPKDILADISEWWRRERSWRMADYEQKTYPNAGLRHLSDESQENAQRRRKDWVTLFLIGLTHTMGRTVADQHRGFLRRWEQEGSLDMIAKSERDPARWMQLVDKFLSEQFDDSKFMQWMKQFVGIYQVSRHLDDYVETFLAVDRIQRPFALTEVTNTRASALFQRGGVDAPPLSRVLGMGQCFIMRELVRLNVISDRNAHRHCYVPAARVRRLLQLLGCEGLDTPSRRWELSPLIHRFLSQHLPGDTAPFFPEFDIPLQIIAEDSLLMDKFFTTEVQFDGDDEPDPWDGDEANAESTEAT